MEVDELQLVVPGFQKLVVTLFDDRPVIRTVLLHPQFLVPVFEFHGEVTKGADQTGNKLVLINKSAVARDLAAGLVITDPIGEVLGQL